MEELVYRAVFLGRKKIPKSPLYNDKNACYRWIEKNNYRVKSDLMLYEINVNACKHKQNEAAKIIEFTNLDYSTPITFEILSNAQTTECTASSKALWGVLTHKEELQFGLANY